MGNLEIYEITYPFIQIEDEYFDEGLVWKPGTRKWFEQYDEACGETFNECDAEGLMILDVKGRHKVKGYHERTFYTRSWKYPDGSLRGNKSELKIITSRAFNKLIKGFRYEYEIQPKSSNIKYLK